MSNLNEFYGISIPQAIPIESLQQDIGIYTLDEQGTPYLLSYQEASDKSLKLKGEQVVWNADQQIVKVKPDAQLGDTYIVQLIYTWIDEETMEPVEEVLATSAIRVVEGTPVPPVTDAHIDIHSLRDIEGIDLETGQLIKAEKFFFPLTHIKAVINDHGSTLDSLLDKVQDNLDNAVVQLNKRIDEIIGQDVKVESLEITPSSWKVGINKVIYIRPDILPVYATNKNLTWESSNTNVATVDNGIITGVAVGNCTIKATTQDGSELSTTCSLKVYIQVLQIQAPSKVDLAKSGDTVTLHPTVIPDNAEDKTLLYSVLDNTVASVDSTGKITAKVNSGTTKVVIKSKDEGATATVNVIIGNIVLVDSITFDKTEETISTGDIMQINATVLPVNATDKTLTWESTNTNVATVDNTGKVVAIKEGHCKIIAKANDRSDSKAECELTVSNPKIFYGSSEDSMEYPTSLEEMIAQNKASFQGPTMVIPDKVLTDDYRTFWIALPDVLTIDSWVSALSAPRDYNTSVATIDYDSKTYTVYYITSPAIIAANNERITIKSA